MHVAHEIRGYRYTTAQDLHGDVPAGADDAENHAGREYEAEGEDHEQEVCPKDAVEGVGGDGLALGEFVMTTVSEGGWSEEEYGEESGRKGEGGSRGGRHGCEEGEEVIGKSQSKSCLLEALSSSA
jgi:hypothetical protein